MTRPLTLQTRLLLLAIVTILATLALTALTIQRGVEESVVVMIDAKMDAQIEAFTSRSAALARAPGAVAFLKDFRDRGLGWGWRVTHDGEAWKGGVRFGQATLDTRYPDDHDGIVSARAKALEGTPLRVRIRRLGPELVEVAAPEGIMNVALQEALRRTVARALLVTLGLIAAAALALSRVVRPLRDLKAAVAKVREGRADTVPIDQPPELRPLAAEINNLLERNAAGLTNARRHVANLAHGLKTPLATLALRQVRDGASEEARTIVADLDRQIDHHLGRARVAAFKVGGANVRTDVADVVDKLLRALRRLHSERELEVAASIPPGLASAVDRQDLEEVTGNLLENAFRHASSRVSIECGQRDLSIVLVVEDDGPGLSDEDAARVLEQGARLGVGAPGRGLGLGICREIAEMYGGRLSLLRAHGAGLRAEMTLPIA